MRLWEGGIINALLKESRTIQETLPLDIPPINIEIVSSKFKQQMEAGNVNRTFHSLKNNMYEY